MKPYWIKRRGGVSLHHNFTQAIWHFRGRADFYKKRLGDGWYGDGELVWQRTPNLAFRDEDLDSEVFNCGGGDIANRAFGIFDEWFWRAVGEAVANRKWMRAREQEWREWIAAERAHRQKEYERLVAKFGHRRPDTELRNAAGFGKELRYLPR